MWSQYRPVFSRLRPVWKAPRNDATEFGKPFADRDRSFGEFVTLGARPRSGPDLKDVHGRIGPDFEMFLVDRHRPATLCTGCSPHGCSVSFFVIASRATATYVPEFSAHQA